MISVEAFSEWATGPAQERVEINLRVYDAWLLLSSVQLTATHPTLGTELRDELTDLGARLQRLITAFAPTEVAQLAAAGWER